MRTVLAGLITACTVVSAQTQERPIELASGAGRNTVEKYCSTCHSLDYILINSYILDGQGWTREVDKMINAFGSPIATAERTIIIDYLVKNYGAGGDTRSKQNR
jgi:hypothetical protein